MGLTPLEEKMNLGANASGNVLISIYKTKRMLNNGFTNLMNQI